MADSFPGVLTAESMDALIRTYFDACNEADVDKIAACWEPDGVHYFPPGMYGGPFRRRAHEIGERWAIAVANFGSVWTVDQIITDAATGRAVIEWTHFKTFQDTCCAVTSGTSSTRRPASSARSARTTRRRRIRRSSGSSSAASTTPAAATPSSRPSTARGEPRCGRRTRSSSSLHALALSRRRARAPAARSSCDRTGGNRDFLRIEPGETAVLLEHDGRRLHHAPLLRDGPPGPPRLPRRGSCAATGTATPSRRSRCRSATSSDSRTGASASSPAQFVAVNPGCGSSHGLNAYFPMPFATGARITLENRGAGAARRAARGLLVPRRVRDLRGAAPRGHRTASTRATGRSGRPTAVGERPNVTLHDGVNIDGARELRRARHRRARGAWSGCVLEIDNLAGRPLVRRGRRHGVRRRRDVAPRDPRHGHRGDLRRRRVPVGRVRGAVHPASTSIESPCVRRARRHVPLVRRRPDPLHALAPLDDRARAREQLRQRLRLGRVLVPVAEGRVCRRCPTPRRDVRRSTAPTTMRWRCDRARRRLGARRAAPHQRGRRGTSSRYAQRLRRSTAATSPPRARRSSGSTAPAG